MIIIVMREKGFATILILLGVLLVTAAAGGVYYFTTIGSNKSKQESAVKPESVNKGTAETIPSSRSVLENKKEVQLASPSSTPGSNRSPYPTPISTPTSKPTLLIPLPTAVSTSAPSCSTNIVSVDTKVTGNSSGAVLSLSPNNGAYKKGESFAIQVNLDPKGHQIDSVDAILRFDPTKVTVISIEEKISQIDYPSKIIDYSSGKIVLSLIDQAYGGKLNNSGALAVINFKVNSSASGNAEVKFDFDPNNLIKTTDSNVVERNNVSDVLGVVVNGSYTIKPDGCN